MKQVLRIFNDLQLFPSRILSGMLCVALASGCGGAEHPDVGDVTGTVTLDGKPIEGAVVKFVPADGRPSVGQTDANGVYSLRYTNDVDGALLGSHRVLITTERVASGGEGGQPLVKARPEILPPRYHMRSELNEEVTAGENTIDFDLKST